MHRMIFWSLVVVGLLCVIGYIFVVVEFIEDGKNKSELVGPTLNSKINIVVIDEDLASTHTTLSAGEVVPLTIEGKTYYFNWKATESLLIMTPNKDDFD